MNIFTDAMTGENCGISVQNTTKKRDIPRHLRCMAVQTAVKDRSPAEVFILFKLEGLKTVLSDSPFFHPCIGRSPA